MQQSTLFQPIQPVRFETKATHTGDAFVFSVPAIETLVDLAEADLSAKSNQTDLKKREIQFVQRNDVRF